jgi:lipopolysaccharide/colanic/teichoic acid biosynthesis glycosyltransferase
VEFSTPGPIFYRQKRVGLNSKTFSPVKFRTMFDDAEKDLGPVLATADDPRITPVGRLLRPLRLDELPQMINVLKGEMSFVGPRPERPFFVEQFCRDIPDYHYRLKVKPGISGLAQVQGKYGSDAADKLRYDLYYIRNYSLLLDLQIIFQTLRVVLIPEAAMGVPADHRRATAGPVN